MSKVHKLESSLDEVTFKFFNDLGIGEDKIIRTIQGDKVQKEKILLNIAFDFDDLVVKSSKSKSEIAKKEYEIEIPEQLYRKDIIEKEKLLANDPEVNTTRRKRINELFYESKKYGVILEKIQNSTNIIEAILDRGHIVTIVSSRKEKGTERMRDFFNIYPELYNYMIPNERFGIPDYIQLKAIGMKQEVKNETLDKLNLDMYVDNTKSKFVRGLLNDYKADKHKLFLFEENRDDEEILLPKYQQILDKEEHANYNKLSAFERDKVNIVTDWDKIYLEVIKLENLLQQQYNSRKISAYATKHYKDENSKELFYEN